MELQKYKLLFGEDIQISKHITLHTPSVGELLDFGESNYFNTLFELTSTSYQLMLFFHDNGVDYVTVPDYQVFLLLFDNIPRENINFFIPSLKDQEIFLAKSLDTGHKVLLNKDNEVVIDEAIYNQLVAYLREMNKTKREFKIPGNEATRNIYIREARLEVEKSKRKKNKEENSSALLAIISSLCNHPGFKYDYHTVRNLSIYALLDAYHRIMAIEDYKNLSLGIYTGKIDSSKINKKSIMWNREL